MSLILRQQCQPILNEYGLGDYHTRINSNKYLSITGPCGQPLFAISGIEFVRPQPTSKEIEFAVELLVDFCLQHKTAILTTLLAKKTLFTAVYPELPKNISWDEANETITSKVTSEINIRYFLKTKEFALSNSGYGVYSITLQQLTKAMNIAAQKNYTKIWKEQKVYADIKTAYNNEIAALQTCNI